MTAQKEGSSSANSRDPAVARRFQRIREEPEDAGEQRGGAAEEQN